jgi:primosomal protein N' (replication factor Y)
MARGAVRTAEELGRAFPNTLVTASGGERIIDTVSGEPQIVISTPGAEPVAEGGYSAVVLLDAHVTLARASLSAGEETVRRWLTAAALARPAAPLVITAEPSVPAVQALMRWDPGWFAARDLAERELLRLPPFMRSAMATGTFAALEEVRQAVPAQTIVHGPFPVDDEQRLDPPLARLLLLTDREQGSHLVHALRGVLSVRAARRETVGLDIRIDPVDWGGEDSHF